MSESIQYKLECMLPDLTALLERGLFTKEELKTILEKRSQFEYSIRSSQRTPQDFYKSILPLIAPPALDLGTSNTSKSWRSCERSEQENWMMEVTVFG